MLSKEEKEEEEKEKESEEIIASLALQLNWG